ncbi:MAG: lactate racemase domain-containing protein, partial [Chloroflexota bacterium]|nr:lactate racemase domain-containing protein [Chloroflexota bacterium]
MLIPMDITYPDVALVEQHINTPRVADVPGAIRAEMARLGVSERVRPGMRVAITAGSRGITGIAAILATVIGELKRLGAEPFIVPCMGSHGGATAQGQVAVLHSLGVTEEAVGCPIRSSMDTVQIGETEQGIPVLIDSLAAGADGIVAVNRIKAHTEYTGPVESGWMKMLTIGLGKHQGALMAHRNAVQIAYREAIVAVAREIIRRAPLLFGLGLVENAYDQTAEVVAAWPQQFEETEKALLQRAKSLMPRLPFQRLDILVVDEIGKEISGSGMDPNVIGRRMVFGEPEPPGPSIIRIVARDLSENTYGSGIGIGLADFTTQRLVDKLDHRPTYINCL